MVRLIRSFLLLAFYFTLAVPIFAQSSAKDVQSMETVLSKFESYAESARKKWNIPGMAVAIVQNDRVIFIKGFGVKKLGGSDPVDGNTVFQIGSTSKAFTSALMATQIDDGKVDWKDQVIDHLPDFEMYDPWVTREFQVRDLMAQHSGMQPYAGDFMAISGFPPEYITSKIKYMKPVTSFRTEFGYVNNLFLTAGDLIHKTSGKSWEESLQTRIFDPLEMKSSSSGQKAFVAASNAASPHKIVKGKITAFSSSESETAWAYTYGPSGGVNSTASDMANWARMLLAGGVYNGKQIIKKENLTFTMSPQTILQSFSAGPFAKTPLAEGHNFYCEGWVYSESDPSPIVWHNGDNSFMHAVIGLIPSKNTGIVILTNLGGTSLGEALMLKFYELYLDTPEFDISTDMYSAWQEGQNRGQSAFAKRPSPVSASQPVQQYTGKFVNPVYGDLTVEVDGQKLWITIGPDKLKMELVHWNHDTFVVSAAQTDAYLGESGTIQFSFDIDGKVSIVTWDALSDVNDGKFVVASSSQ